MPPESGKEPWSTDAVVAAVLAPKGRGSGTCWVNHMPDDIKTTVRLLEEINLEDPGRINRAEFRRQIMEATKGTPVKAPSREAMGRHFRGECACR